MTAHQLPERTRQILSLELTRNTTYQAIGSVAFTCYGQDLTFDQYSDLLWESELGRLFYEESALKTRGQFDKKIRRAWDYTDDHFDWGYRERSVRERLGDLLARIQAAPWPGRGGSSERAVAIALVNLGHEVNRYTVDASTRELATRAKIGRSTVSKALVRLATKGLFTARTSGESGTDHADTFHLDLDWEPLVPISGHTKLSGSHTTLCVPVLVTTEHSAFTRAALGKSAGRVWDYLMFTAPESGATVDEIQRATGISPNTVRTQLKRMTDHHLVTKHGQRGARYTVSPDADLDRVAEEYGQEGYEERTAERFQRERACRTEQLRQWATQAQEIRDVEIPGPQSSESERRIREELSI
ncbi:hypothetical protein [Rhodococcus opacus]|uniref:hypothetical protein n=1 Tax=Rhodococcus opacus TaxID=37919 RepID=UPI00294A03FE|nr:hypothetical protein [Rhodococcus opacus]MDV6246878.1 hypothetical protein [Rhodococcus opacus]